jgi:hypothetical protein
MTLLEMEESLREIEKGILGVQMLFSDEEKIWWNTFFEEQRQFNQSLLLEEKCLSFPFQWPSSQMDTNITMDVPEVSLNEEEIEERVYGPTRDIYVGPYRNQEKNDVERENMEGDFSDLQINTFISVAGEDFQSFWIAKVEKIIQRDEFDIPKMISVLWHASKQESDPWKAKYFPEILNYEKKKSGREKGTLKPIWFHQDLDLSSTTVFAYNFMLTKSDTLYKKTVDRIKIRLLEFIEDEKVREEEECRLQRNIGETTREKTVV